MISGKIILPFPRYDEDLELLTASILKNDQKLHCSRDKLTHERFNYSNVSTTIFVLRLARSIETQVLFCCSIEV